MKEKIIRLKELREQMEKLNARKKAANEKYLTDNNELFSEVEKLAGQLTQTEIEIKEMALNEYSETGEKKLKFGVGIRIMKKLEYEEAEAFAWAKEHSMALSLDKRSFDKIARADPMDFIKINEIPQATLPFVIEVKDE
ncbi:MAG: hypothetical protein V3V78_00415 [Candidatus Woesearchaeota archaeon]